MQHIHIIGICGTFMAGVAQIAKAAGYRVSGCDQQVYPPMSTQLEDTGIEIMQGYSLEHLQSFVAAEKPDEIIIGNAMSRGVPIVEAVLNQGIPYTSGPEWLSRQVLQKKWVLAVSGTHGKTTTSAMLTWILEYAGFNPGFLIGGVPENFDCSARLGDSSFFVIEADEYDTAFFDKRSKFVHYRPRTLSINNLEFDHADIFDDLGAIQKQFHHLIRCVPSEGRIIAPSNTNSVSDLLNMGCWSEVERFQTTERASAHGSTNWQIQVINSDFSQFEVVLNGETQGTVDWSLLGEHNAQNALCAIASARHVGVMPNVAIEALAKFKSVKRRMELRANVGGIKIFDDFAHHPTAIKTTLNGLRHSVGGSRIIAVLELRSNTMQMGCHNEGLPESLTLADEVLICAANDEQASALKQQFVNDMNVSIYSSAQEIVERLSPQLQSGDYVLVMSNGAFDGIHLKLEQTLESKRKHKIKTA